jgi:uncharacterized membrane protein YdjX (TVP38/TMEM64 family)
MKLNNIIFIVYFIIILLLLFFVFNFDLLKLMNYKYLSTNLEYLKTLVEKNIYFYSLIFFVFAISWVFFMGFGTVVIIIASILFEPLLATILIILSVIIGSTGMFLISRYLNYSFFNKVTNKLKNNYLKFIKDDSLLAITLFRLIPGIPLPVRNILPSYTNINTKNFIIGCFFW